jgi:hypothetical protein
LAAVPRDIVAASFTECLRYAKMASVSLKLDNVAEALVSLRKGREITAALVDIAPGFAQWKQALAWFDGEIARIKVQTQQTDKN